VQYWLKKLEEYEAGMADKGFAGMQEDCTAKVGCSAKQYHYLQHSR
jgi:hypothetical protein